MTRYQKHMQHVHNMATAMSIEIAVNLVVEDIIDHLTKNGVKSDSQLIKDIRKLGHYDYNPKNLNSSI